MAAKSFAAQVDGDAPKPKVEHQQHKLSELEKNARKRDKKSKFKDIKNKFKARGFDARVTLSDKESVATYLNEEFQMYSQRLIDLHEKQAKAIADAKHLRRRKHRQEKSEMRRAGKIEGFNKAHPVYDDSLLPKMTVDANELQLVKDVR
jgi:uncharacterized protein YozE (UPF0346 family)